MFEEAQAKKLIEKITVSLTTHRGIQVRDYKRDRGIKRLLAADAFVGSEEPYSFTFILPYPLVSSRFSRL